MGCHVFGVRAEGRYLYFHLDVLPCRYKLIQCLLGVFHVAAVLAINQQPGEGHNPVITFNSLSLPVIVQLTFDRKPNVDKINTDNCGQMFDWLIISISFLSS